MLIKEWKGSGKTLTKWCREHGIPKTSFTYWVKREFSKKKTGITRDDFAELRNEISQADVLIEWRGCKIHITRDIDSLMLEKCLRIIGRQPC